MACARNELYSLPTPTSCSRLSLPLIPTHDRLRPAELAQALFSEIGHGLFLLDPETDQLIEVNPVVLRLTGFTRAELLSLSAAYLFPVFEAAGRAAQAGAFTKTMVFHWARRLFLRTKDHTWVPVSLTVSRLHLAPKTLGLIIARDDRERRACWHRPGGSRPNCGRC